MSRATGRALWLPDVIRDAGLEPREVEGWRTRGRLPREWIAQVNHHTASNVGGGNAPSLTICTSGRPGLPGPLCNTLPARDGTIYVVASGVANHAGVAYLPLRGGISSGVNYWTLGHEIELSGTGEPFPRGGRRYEIVARLNAAIAAYLSHDPLTQLFDHKSICVPPGRKIDVNPYSLPLARLDVARKLQPTTPPPTEEDELMAAKDEILAAIEKTKPYTVRVGTSAPGMPAGSVWICTPFTRRRAASRDELNLLYLAGQVQVPSGGSGREPTVDPDFIQHLAVL